MESWKEIAAYLNRTVRTVQRWEREQRLPVHRLVHHKLATIYAYPEELDRWWQERRTTIDGIPEAADDATVEVRRRIHGRGPVIVLAALLLVTVGGALATIWRPGADEASTRAAEQRYLRGRQCWNQRTPEGFQKALREFELALTADAGHVGAFCGLADTYSLLQALGIMAAEDALPKARAAAERALALDADSGEALASMSFVLWAEGRRQDALETAARAIERRPDYATARHWYALYLQDSGRLVEAIEHASAAQRLDPLSPIIGSDLSIMLRNADRLEDARALLERLIAAHPTYPALHAELANVHVRSERLDLALRHQKHAIDYGDTRPPLIARLAWLEAVNGNAMAAVGAARRLVALRDQGVRISPDDYALAMTAAGDVDAAFETLDRSLTERHRWVVKALTDEAYAPLRDDVRWPRYHERIKELSRGVAETQLPAVSPVR